MNRSLTNVLFAGVGAGPVATAGATAAGGKTHREITVEDAAVLLSNIRSLIIVPGYGMAVAQAQHAVRDMADLLAARGVDVKYAIHPVAGRMPGHMNVLLAEANVPYDPLFDLEQSNPDFERAGFAGIDNPLYYLPNTMMLFGDAKGAVTKLVEQLRAEAA
jgi:NAD(P) transhydrogenase subunit beta